MNGKKALTGAVMLETQWATRKNDIIDLITPFVEYCVAKITSPSEVIDITKVAGLMQSNFGYVDIPEAIIISVFKRNTAVFVRKNRKYFLGKSLDEIVFKIEQRKKDCERSVETVGEALFQYLSERCQHEKIHTKDQALQRLHDFFVLYGIDVGAEKLRIDTISRKNAETLYYIARFIVEKKHDAATDYSRILDLVKGYYLETAMYLQPENGNLLSASYRDVVFYYDTPFLLQLLGYQSEEEEKKARSLHEMLKRQKASFRYFPQTKNEIMNILTAYGHSLNSGVISNRTLDGLDAKRYNSSDVERLKNTFAINLHSAFGVELTELPAYPQKPDGSVDEKTVLSEKDIESFIREKIGHYRPESLRADIDSGIAIHKLRNGSEGTNIEECRHLFVTTNIDFSNAFNSYYRQEVKRDTFDLIIDAGRLSAITWIKCGSIDVDVPELQLLENAYSAQQPPAELMEKFTEVLTKMESEGEIGYEEAISIRSDHYSRKELLLRSNGVLEKVDDTFIEGIREDYKEHLVVKTRQDITSEMKQHFQAEQERKDKEIRDRAESAASSDEKETRERCIKFWNSIVIAIAVMVIALGIYGCLMSSSLIWNIPCAIFMGLSLVSVYDTVKAREKLFSKIIIRHANAKGAEAYDREYKKYMNVYAPKQGIESDKTNVEDPSDSVL